MAALAGLAGLAGASVEAAEDGEAVARAHCARCHVIGATNPMGGIGSTPSFYLMAEKIADYEPRLRSFAARRPHAALSFEAVDAAALEALIAYIRALERP